MRLIKTSIILLIVVLIIASCTPTEMTPLVEILPTVIPVQTLTIEQTLSPDAARDQLRYFLQTNGKCEFPCFWGIQPDQTSYDELYDIFYRVGGIGSDTLLEDSHLRVSTRFSFEERSGIFVSIEADVQDEIVKDLKVDFAGLLDSGISPEDWSAYNMGKILKTYGVPDVAEVYLDIPYDTLTFGIRLKYEKINTSITYWGLTEVNDEYLTSSSAIFCPEKIGIYFVELHIGKHPFNYGTDGVSLSEATDLDEETFHKLFTENPSACFAINRKVMDSK